MKSKKQVRSNKNKSKKFRKMNGGGKRKINMKRNKTVKIGGNINDDLVHAIKEHNYDKVVGLILNEGADVNAMNQFGETPLHVACWKGNMKIVAFLYGSGANINAVSKYGRTPLLDAIHNTQIAVFLINKGADMNYEYNGKYTGFSPFIVAVNRNNIELVRFMIEKGADVNRRSDRKFSKGDTPLHYACRKNYIELALMLIDKGANVNAMNKFGEIPFNYIDPSDYKYYGLDPNDKLKDRFIKDGVYELRKYKEIYVPIMIIPKGTILFRGYKDDNIDLITDFCGVTTGNDRKRNRKYCLNKNHNVFFYPYPAYWTSKFKIFVLTKTIKVVNFINPSYLTRLNEDPRYDFKNYCDKIETNFCGNYTGADIDICLSNDFLENNKDINGMIAIAEEDAFLHEKNYELLKDYSLFAKDKEPIFGIPELILYPKEERSLNDIFWNEIDCSYKDGIYHYLINSRDYDLEIMKQLLHHNGYKLNNTTIHVTIYSPLKMYVVWEYLEEEYKKDCVPINWSSKSKLSQFQSDINNLNKDIYKERMTYNRYFSEGGKSRKTIKH